MPSIQAPAAVVMVRPHRFASNPQTAHDNAFQRTDGSADSAEAIARRAFDEGGQDTPDSVFPNNGFSTHPGGHVALYPMFATNRRCRSGAGGLFVEGTGAMARDHMMRVAYTARSNRADPIALERLCTHFNFEPVAFDTADAAAVPACSPCRKQPLRA